MVKRSETLAVENAQRIALQLRNERNDAIALAQEIRDDLEAALKIIEAVKASGSGLSAEQAQTAEAIRAKYR